MIIGYARISTETQVLNQQIDALVKWGVDERNIYKEQISTRALHRPELEKVLTFIRNGDTLVVCKLDRLSRSLEELIKFMDDFRQKGINFVSINEQIDTTSASGKLQFQIIASFAEFERNIISERTKEALQAVKKRGQKLGRPFVLNQHQKELIDRLLEDGCPKLAIMKTIGIKSTTPIYNYLREKGFDELIESQKEIIDRLILDGKTKVEISKTLGLKSNTAVYNYLRKKKQLENQIIDL
jgi:DNA invertase Pin-like site-specific DNA recombinase